jgi:molybdenum cofactor cytidylyltransferase
LKNLSISRKIISAIILAAGKSERFGAPKVLQSFKNVPFLVRIVDSLQQANVDFIFLVLGFQADKMIEKLPKIENVEIVINKDFESGQFSSLQAGIRKLTTNTEGCLICLIDQPQIQSRTVKRILYESKLHSDKIIIPTFADRGGHPVYVPKSLFAEIKNSSSSTSLRDVFGKNVNLIHRFEVNDPLMIEDIDTPNDLEKIEKLWN